MALNIAVPLSGVGGLSPISPMNMECWEQIKMLVSPIGSESSGISSLDSEEAKHQSLQSTPPDTPEEFEIRYTGRDILDLGSNINPHKWHLRYTYLPENNNMPMYLANRSQYHRLGPNGHIQDYTLVACEHCDFQYPINSGSSYFCRTSVTVSPTTTSTMTYTGPQVLKRPQQPPQQQQPQQQKSHQPNQQLQSLTTPLQHLYHSNNSNNNSFSMFNHNQMNSNSFLKKTTAAPQQATTISTAATSTLSSIASSSSVAAAMPSYAASSPTSSLSSGYSSSSSNSGYTNMNFGAGNGGPMKYPQQSPSNNSSNNNNPFMNIGNISNNNTKSAMSSNGNNSNTFNNNFCSFLNAFSNTGNNNNGYMNHTQGSNNAGQQPHYGTYNYF